MRKTISILLLILLVAAAAPADTIHLKNGSVLKGKVASFSDDQFVVLLDMGNGRFMSRAMIYIGDVARIEFDGAPAASEAGRETAPAPQPADTAARDTKSQEASPRETTLPGPKPAATDRQPPASQPTEPEKTEKPPTVDTSDAEQPPRKLTGPVRTQNVDVMAKRDWTSTGLIVKRGDRIRISASGAVTLDQGSGRTSGPEGIDLSDTRKLMSDHPTGALIGVIGADNDDFIFIGRGVDFTATRDGLLFLSVNEGVLADNTGSYKAVIEVQSQGNKK
jgi:hypothetical protein